MRRAPQNAGGKKMKKAVHFGAGNIGRGFIGELLHDSGFAITFVEVGQEIVDRINETGSYDIYIINRDYEKKTIDNVRAYSPITQEDKIVDAIVEADIVTTSVWADNLPKIANTLAKGLKKRLAAGGSKVDVLACENAFFATDMLKKALQECKEALTEAQLEQIGGFANVSVDRIALNSVRDGVSVPEIDEAFELVIEKNKLADPASEPIKGADYADNLGMYLERKLYMVNSGHAAAAYLGYLKGCKTVQDALQDTAIMAAAQGTMQEAAKVLARKFNFSPESLEAFIAKNLKRFTFPALQDDVLRVGRAPIRKLSENDRLVGPAKQAASYGFSTRYLSQAIAAAFLFDAAEDEQAVEVQQYLQANGIEKALEHYTHIAADTALGKEILAAYKALQA